MSNEVVKQSDGGFGDVFSSGLPSMVGIVVAVSQPFVQVRDSFGWPLWLPYALALMASGALAYYRIVVVRRSAPVESAILVPLLALVIFSAYVAGNNVVFYTKEGYSRPGATAGPPGAELETLKTERELLKQKLQSAEELITVLRQVVPSSSGKSQSSRSSLLGLGILGVDDAWAQVAPAQPGGRRSEKLTPQQLQDMLKNYDAQQRELDRKLKETRKEQEKAPAHQQSTPLLKSW